MWCSNCGAKLPDNAAACPACGKMVANYNAAPAAFGFASAGSLLEETPAPETLSSPKMAPVRETPTVQVPPVTSVETPVAPVRPAAPVQPPVTPVKPVQPVKPAVIRGKPAIPVHKPAASKPAAAGHASRRIPVGKELRLLLRQGWLVMLGEKRNLIFCLLFPLIAAAVTVWVAGSDMFETMESTKSACFVLVCEAIWCGLFNSIQIVVKERENIKRDYVSGALRIECYVASRAILQMVLCLVQSAGLVLAIPGVEWQYGNHMPKSGLIFPEPMVDYFISLFLVMYAADMLGILVSSLVKKQELASQLAPYILIAQLLFSGVLFKMKGSAETLSGVMISRWGMEALGSISDLNDIPLKIIAENDDPMLEELIDRSIEAAFKSTDSHLVEVWLILLLFIVVQVVAANFCLYGVKKDTRN